MESFAALIALASKDQRQVLDAALSSIGLNVTGALILDYLSFARDNGQEEMSQTELAECIGVSKASVGVAVEVLEARGLLRREADPRDGRARSVVLADEGEAKASSMRDIRAVVFARIVADISESELATLESTLVKIRRNLRRLREQPAIDGDGAQMLPRAGNGAGDRPAGVSASDDGSLNADMED